MATIEPNFESICINPNDDLVLYKKEIVRSRIEKFLYAICSLDTDDLPAPLSRIEELYNCLVTGEDIPTFTPLSRAEKFVMAMLGAYDVELLPTPISRSETLMKKIATGDNNLDDVDNLQSRYEFLLAYIIKAGGFNGGNPDDSRDFYYKLTSLTSGFTIIYDTSVMPVKNAVLRGQTVVNLARNFKYQIACRNEWDAADENTQRCCYNVENAKSGTKYLIKNFNESTQAYIRYFSDSSHIALSESGWLDLPAIITTPKTATRFAVSLRISDNNEEYISPDQANKNLVVECQGDVENWDIPYFEGMASVKMPVLTTVGKNLFDGEFKLSTYSSGKIIIPNGIISSVSFPYTTTANSRGICCITQVKPNTNYTISIVDKQENTVLLGDGYNNLNDISSQTKSVLHVGSVDNANHTTLSFTTPSNCNYMVVGCYIKYSYAQSGGTITFNEPPKIQLEENSVSTPHEPHKSNILTCNEEVELRKIGDMRDELNLVTGELTQYVGVITIDDSHSWRLNTGMNGEQETYIVFQSNYVFRDYKYVASNLNIINDNFPLVGFGGNANKAGEWLTIGSNGLLYVKISLSKLDTHDVNGFKKWLLQNPITIQYELAETIVKTVDLSTLDQDGKKTELSTFDDITHVIVSSEGLVPTGDIITSRPIHFMNYSLDNSLTTFDNTVEYQVKNAVLRGQTLVNLVGECRHNISTVENPKVWAQKRLFLTNVKTNTRYTMKVKMTEKVEGSFGPRVQVFLGDTSSGEINTTSSDTLIFTSPSVLSSQPHLRLITTGATAEQTDVDFEILLLEGEFPVGCDIPYFDHMTIVKMPVLTTTGKNLFDIDKINTNYRKNNDNTEVTVENNKLTIVSKNNGRSFIHQLEPLYLKPNTEYTFSITGSSTGDYRRVHLGTKSLVDNNQYKTILFSEVEETKNVTFITDDTGYLFIHFYPSTSSIATSIFYNIQLEEGSTATSYEPYKSNILTCNEEVELRSIGDVRDELNLVTGELTQRIQERVFDGSEKWIIGGTGDNYIMFRCENYTDMVKSSNAITCDKYAYTKLNNATSNLSVTNSTTGKICIVTSQTDLSIDNFKAKLNTDKPTIQYQLAEPIVKTVDLSTLDQDGKETDLNTFDDITHVTVSSEGLVPTGDIDIARPIQFVDYSLDNGEATLYNTIDYPVKSAVLKGSTLKNINDYNIAVVDGVSINDGVITVNASSVYREVFIKALELKPSTKYLVRYEIIENTLDGIYELNSPVTSYNDLFGKQLAVSAGYVGEETMILTTRYDISTVLYTFRSYISSKVTSGYIKYRFMAIEYQDGMENWDIPYFTGIQSVKMPVLTTTGKNLFDGDTIFKRGYLNYTTGKFNVSSNATDMITDYIPFSSKGEFVVSYDGNNRVDIVCYDNDKNYINGAAGNGSVINITENTTYIIVMVRNTADTKNRVQIERGTVPTPFEPYKSTTVTIDSDVLLTTEKDHFIITENGSQIVLYNNEEVELRGIGDIKDELNLTTGELTQRIGEFVLDGSSDELWGIDTNGSGFKRFVSKVKKTHSNYLEITNWLPTTNKSYWSINENGFYIGTNSSPVIVFNTNDSRYNMTVTEFENYLSQNPLIVQYPLTEETIKTVTLSTLDQDGKETELTTFDDITHVTVSSEGLIPTGEITVATKDATDVIDASVMSLRMDDILNSQSTLEGSANAQSDDIDVAMLGTTDIYEQLL